MKSRKWTVWKKLLHVFHWPYLRKKERNGSQFLIKLVSINWTSCVQPVTHNQRELIWNWKNVMLRSGYFMLVTDFLCSLPGLKEWLGVATGCAQPVTHDKVKIFRNFWNGMRWRSSTKIRNLSLRNQLNTQMECYEDSKQQGSQFWIKPVLCNHSRVINASVGSWESKCLEEVSYPPLWFSFPSVQKNLRACNRLCTISYA
jgi:hypothetical protein